MQRLLAKTSTVYIATATHNGIYRSVGDVPAPLRGQLEKSTSGWNSATIFIADERGREELIRALQNKSNGASPWLPAAIRTRQAKRQSATGWWRRFLCLRFWLEILLPATIGASLWIFFEYHP